MSLEEEIRKNSDGLLRHCEIICLKSTESTNKYLKELALKRQSEAAFAAYEAMQPVLVVAEAQSEGRGRLGRSFYSPSGSGIYFSILLRPASPCEAGAVEGGVFDFPALTAAAALSVCEAVFKFTDGKKQPKIKWVNDIFCEGRKICGILSEGLSDAESGRLIACVLGIGINLHEPQGGFSGMGLKEAGAIFEGGSFPSEKDEELKGRLIAEILKRLFYYYGLSDKGELREKYRALSIAVGRKVRVLKNGGEREALAEYIDDGFGLTVSYEDGSRERLFSGEVSLRI